MKCDMVSHRNDVVTRRQNEDVKHVSFTLPAKRKRPVTKQSLPKFLVFSILCFLVVTLTFNAQHNNESTALVEAPPLSKISNSVIAGDSPTKINDDQKIKAQQNNNVTALVKEPQLSKIPTSDITRNSPIKILEKLRIELGAVGLEARTLPQSHATPSSIKLVAGAQ